MKPSKLLISLLFILAFELANGQDTTKTPIPEVVSLNKVNIFIPSLGLEREQKLTATTTLTLGINYQFTFLREYIPYMNYNGYSLTNQGVATNSKLKAVPGANLNYRYYYNLDVRHAKNKSTLNNTADYIGLDFGAVFPKMFNEKNQYNYQIAITPNWGIQRTQNKNANFEFAVGPSLVINPYEVLLGVGIKVGASIL